ncbi:Dolichol kinase sec59 [Cladobotryum mycophilum]|uniref:dolichol kinase n=1 Tax=Cladobotryum mycophilum TaxID=491253 RepID=A0ABR0SNA6_9HYPO
MPEHLNHESTTALDPDEQDTLRTLNRSPHPYHHQHSDLPHPSELLVSPNETAQTKPEDDPSHHSSPTLIFSKDSTPASDSGTDADDEHFLKGLPAPKARPHKGLRGRNEIISGTTTPVLSPGLGEEESGIPLERKIVQHVKRPEEKRRALENVRRKKVIVRRATEVGIIIALAVMIGVNRQVYPVVKIWRQDFQFFGLLYLALLVFYPLRLVTWAYLNRQPSISLPFRIPSNFDPAPILYPSAITIFVSLLVSVNNPAVILPNLILGISAIPQQLVPKVDLYAPYDTLHWALSCLPLIWHTSGLNSSFLKSTYTFLPAESLVLLYPLHRILSVVLHHLTTTSLLTAELQLLSIALVNVLLLAASPQVQILKALIWGGGLSILVLCGAVIQWGIALARVPKWRFRRQPYPQKRPFWKTLIKSLSWQRILSDILGAPLEQDDDETPYSSEEDEDVSLLHGPSRVRTLSPSADVQHGVDGDLSSPEQDPRTRGISRRHTVPHADRSPRRVATHTPSGRKKRTASVSVRAYFKLTYWQATVKKWVYAAYVYVCLLVIIVAVIRVHIQRYALDGNEPIGWALGYLFGGLNWFRFQVVFNNLERWICLPERFDVDTDQECHLGWVQHIRHADFGEANTRLIIGGYWVAILIVGLAIVFQLKDTYEVDTRRKVFHFMMVGMLLPATYVDPAFVALALSIVLAVFLILDLLRASQLPPLSKPIASFLAPYVDGRDFRGPVVISHIFLLIGCAIPLWLSLASLPRTGSGYLAGWEIPTKEVSMVSGVICVGLGDAAASLIGRRYGHRKWLWGGGKSLEGSAAFTVAVFLGLTVANTWIRIGKWPTTGEEVSLTRSATHSFACASMGSLTEAVLTGGNDNVIVPIILWTCVKALEI